MRDHCNCGRPFSLDEWVRLPTEFYQACSDCDGTLVQQAVNCPRCGTTLVSAELEVVRGVYGPCDKVHDVIREAEEWRVVRDRHLRRDLAKHWHTSVPLVIKAAA